jgi:hypothetical protein
MKSPSAYFAVVCFLAALGLGAFAWRQHNELVLLRATALNTDDRAALQKRLWDAEKRAREADTRAGAAQASQNSGEKPVDESTGGEATKKAAPADKKGPSQMEILAFLNNPESQHALTEKLRGVVDARYAALFKSLNLSPPQLERLKSLLLERQSAAVDVAAASLAQGLKPNQNELRTMISSAQDETDRKLQTELGAQSYAQFQTYENAQLFRGATTNLQHALTRVDAGLSDAQAEQFTTDITTIAQNSFTPAQTQALRTITQLQQTQQTFQQVEQLYKEKQAPTKPTKKKGG